MQQLQAVLKNDLKDKQCQVCGITGRRDTVQIHLKSKSCITKPAHYDQKIFLTLDNKAYFCQMGCSGFFN